MDISRVKYNLGKAVRLKLPKCYIDSEYILTGCIIRKKTSGEYFYQAELTDKISGSVLITSLGDIYEGEMKKDDEI